MRRSLFALLFACLPGLAFAQMQPGDLLLNSSENPEVLVHFRPDGTVVQQTSGGSGLQWSGAAISPDGNWVTTRRLQHTGVNIFDGATGAEVASWDIPGDNVAYDVGVFSDGSLAVLLLNGLVVHFDITGNVIDFWDGAQNPWGILVDDQDEVWTCSLQDGLHHTDAQGNLINEFSTGGGAGDVTMAQDGTLFVTRWQTGEVAHYAQDGTFLGSFLATNNSVFTLGIAMGEDQTVWVTGDGENLLRNFDQAGNLLGSFDVGPVGKPKALSSLISADDFATNYCGPANPNSTGRSAVISARGSTVAAHNFFTLTASRLPPSVFGYFLNSDTQGFTPLPPGSQGDLCLGGGIGRHVKQVVKSDAAGKLASDLDLSALPRPGGAHSVVAGETWNFQLWYRDKNPGNTSNFTDALSVLFK